MLPKAFAHLLDLAADPQAIHIRSSLNLIALVTWPLATVGSKALYKNFTSISQSVAGRQVFFRRVDIVCQATTPLSGKQAGYTLGFTRFDNELKKIRINKCLSDHSFALSSIPHAQLYGLQKCTKMAGKEFLFFSAYHRKTTEKLILKYFFLVDLLHTMRRRQQQRPLPKINNRSHHRIQSAFLQTNVPGKKWTTMLITSKAPHFRKIDSP